MNYEQAKKEIAKMMKRLAPKHSLHKVFRDFTTMGAIFVSNRVDKEQFDKREAQYMQTVGKYSKDEARLFGEMLGALIMGLENKMGDLLGETYMLLEISNKDQGQFFTSYDVAKLMADMTVNDAIERIEKQGYVTVNDPAIGGGVTVIAMAAALRSRGYNYQKCMRVIGQDIDSDLVRLCYLQLSLLGIDAVITRGDTLAYKFDDYWYTPIHILNNAQEKQVRRTKKMAQRMTDIIKSSKNNQLEPVQMSLF